MLTIGIVGYGLLGQYLADQIQKSLEFDLKFVWNRTTDRIRDKLDPKMILEHLENCPNVDLIIEVSHPDVTRKYGQLLLAHANLMIGSPTVLCDDTLRNNLDAACKKHNHIILVPAGALWGAEDISKMAQLDQIQSLHVTMRKHPSCFKFESPLKEINENITEETIIYEGPVKNVCPLAPNNVNTMAAACIAAKTLGFEEVIGKIVSDPKLTDHHIVIVNIESKGGLRVVTQRTNPSKIGAVTGSATYSSFLSSLKSTKV